MIRLRTVLMVMACLVGVTPACTTAPPPTPGPIDDLPVWDAEAYPWPMFAQNARRIGQSPFDGPSSATPSGARNWSYSAIGAAVLNIQAVVSAGGVYFGGWGVLRRDTNLTPDQWDKLDGRFYGLHLEARGSDAAQELFAPQLPALTHTGYLYAGRTKQARDEFWCGAGNDYLVSYYNGTIEGTPVIDPDDGTLYVGRGDGKLFAIDPATGTNRWVFTTFNPELPDDPDGGGEIIGGPLMGAGKIIYFGTAGLPLPSTATDPLYETSAVYAVTATGGLHWRYPSATARLENWIMAPPALSADGRTLYVGTFAGDTSQPGRLIALDLTQPADASDEARLKWSLELRNSGQLFAPHLYVRSISVGADGIIYVGAAEAQFLGLSPAVVAVADRGTRGEFHWGGVVEPQGYPAVGGQFTAGIALRETNGNVDLLYASTSHLRNANGVGGALFAMRPSDGAVLHSFDPAAATPPAIGGLTAPTIGANGLVYVGVRGKHPNGPDAGVNGRVLALSYSVSDGFALLWNYEAEGQLDWVPPAIGANGAIYFGTSAAHNPIEQTFWYGPNDTPANRSPLFYAIFE